MAWQSGGATQWTVEIYPATLETSLWPGIGTLKSRARKRRQGRFVENTQ
jgi:hypothetical protein